MPPVNTQRSKYFHARSFALSLSMKLTNKHIQVKHLHTSYGTCYRKGKRESHVCESAQTASTHILWSNCKHAHTVVKLQADCSHARYMNVMPAKLEGETFDQQTYAHTHAYIYAHTHAYIYAHTHSYIQTFDQQSLCATNALRCDVHKNVATHFMNKVSHTEHAYTQTHTHTSLRKKICKRMKSFMCQ
jgi:hypothetical protein